MAKMLPWLLSVSLLGSRQFMENPKAEAISQRLEAPRLPALQFNQPRYDFSKAASGTDIATIRRNPLEERTRSVYVGAHNQNALDQRYTDVTDNWNHLYGSTPISINPRLLYGNSPSHSNSRLDFATEEIDDDYGAALSLVYAWSTIDFEFDDIDTRDYAIFDGSYIAENNLPLGLAIHSDRVFVTLPKWKDGIPATLTTIPKRSKAMSPKLRPYPDWTWHRAEKCDGLTSVFRIEIDECERLWVLDSGKVNVATKPEQLCKPVLFIFDLTTDTMLRRYDLPEDQVKQDSLYSNIAVDVREGDCGAAVAYLSDVWRFGLVVYDFFKDSSFRIEHHLFYPEPLASRYQLHGLKFHWTDGIFGIALSPIDVNNDRTLFFHPMSSFREFAVSTSILREKESAQKHADEFTPIGRARAKDYGHSSGSVVDRNGVMFFNMVTRDSVWCWDTRKEYLPQNLGVIGTSNVSLVFPNDIKVDHEKEQNVWLLSNRLPMYLYGRLDSNKINYRIFKANTKDAVKGTVCDPNYMLVTSYGETYDEVTC